MYKSFNDRIYRQYNLIVVMYHEETGRYRIVISLCTTYLSSPDRARPSSALYSTRAWRNQHNWSGRIVGIMYNMKCVMRHARGTPSNWLLWNRLRLNRAPGKFENIDYLHSTGDEPSRLLVHCRHVMNPWNHLSSVNFVVIWETRRTDGAISMTAVHNATTSRPLGRFW